MKQKPRLGFWQIWNMGFGFLGIQFGFALQNANASSVLQSLGAEVHQLSWFWLVAPLTGMIIQPIVGYFSDKTWNRLGRRRPYFLVGALLTSTALILMPNSPHLAGYISPMFIGGGMLMIMDASMNITMEPFRALVADKLPEEQHNLGFSMQTLLIGIGAVVGSALPYILSNWFGVSNEPQSEGLISPNVTLSFYIGAGVLLSAVLWTITTTKEYPPEYYEDEKESAESIEKSKGIKIPKVMLQLLLVQFFSWFALFTMWVYSVPAISFHFYDTVDPYSIEYNNVRDWIGPLFGIYNGVSAIIALSLPKIAARIGRKRTHAIALSIGGLSFLSFMIMPNENWLVIPMVGIGIAWGSILAMPYAMLANKIPAKKMGLYMGLFNMSITIPQIVNGITGGIILHYFFNDNPMLSIMLAGVFMIFAAISTLFISEKSA